MTVFSKFERRTILIGSACLLIGIGLGVVIEQWLLWNRLDGRFNELIRRLAIIEDEIRNLRVRLRTSKSSNEVDGVRVSIRKPRSASDLSDNDEFQDAESEMDDFMSVTSDFSFVSHASHETFFREIDSLLDGSYADKQRAYEQLREKRIRFSDRVEFLWRWARAGYYMFEKEGGHQNEQAKQYVYESFFLVEKALKVDNQSAKAHKWYAIIIGLKGECEGTQQKIKNGYEFKEHIDRAIELDPTDHEVFHLKGRFCYAVYMLTWIERQMASALFATPPTATIEDALEAFMQCEKILPDRLKKNQLHIALCYIQLKDIPEAVSWLRRASNIETSDEFDMKYQTEITDLLAKHAQ